MGFYSSDAVLLVIRLKWNKTPKDHNEDTPPEVVENEIL